MSDEGDRVYIRFDVDKTFTDDLEQKCEDQGLQSEFLIEERINGAWEIVQYVGLPDCELMSDAEVLN